MYIAISCPFQPNNPGASDPILSIQSLLEELLTDVAHCYFQLGLLLGLPHGKVREISINHPSDAQRCLIEVLNHRLTQTPDLTWFMVGKALDAIGQGGVADRIRSKHCGIRSPAQPQVYNA